PVFGGAGGGGAEAAEVGGRTGSHPDPEALPPVVAVCLVPIRFEPPCANASLKKPAKVRIRRIRNIAGPFIVATYLHSIKKRMWKGFSLPVLPQCILQGVRHRAPELRGFPSP